MDVSWVLHYLCRPVADEKRRRRPRWPLEMSPWLRAVCAVHRSDGFSSDKLKWAATGL